MKEKLSFSQLLSLSLMLFALFFGAGNMIFPPAMGQSAGTHVWPALAGFITADVGLPVLAIAAVVLTGRTMTDLAGKAGKKFATFFPVLIYIMIGPLFAIPRTASTSFELALFPFLGADSHVKLWSALFTGLFFLATFLLSANPQKIVYYVGKILTPILLLSIFIIGIGGVIHPISPMGNPVDLYAEIPFFKGLTEGYLAMDALAAGVFALVVIENVEAMGVQNEKKIVSYTLLAGIGAAIGLAVVYGLLAYVGATSGALGTFENGGQLLTAVSKHMYGTAGMLVLGVAVLFACLTTSIGLTTSFGNYFSETFPKLEYQPTIIAVCLFSFVVSNIGLTQLISITLPVLLMVYPVLMALIFAAFLDKWIHGKTKIYGFTLIGTALVSIPSGLEALAANFGTSLGTMSEILAKLPMYDIGMGWIIPGIIGGIIGALFSMGKKQA